MALMKRAFNANLATRSAKLAQNTVLYSALRATLKELTLSLTVTHALRSALLASMETTILLAASHAKTHVSHAQVMLRLACRAI